MKGGRWVGLFGPLRDCEGVGDCLAGRKEDCGQGVDLGTGWGEGWWGGAGMRWLVGWVAGYLAMVGGDVYIDLKVDSISLCSSQMVL